MDRTRHFGDISSIKTDGLCKVDNQAVQIVFTAANASPVSIACFDSRGRLVSSGHIANVNAGLNQSMLAGHFGPGMHMVRITQGNYSTVSKVVVTGR
jgi:hypothetical protein